LPLYFEICVEALYPIGEGLITGMQTVMNNIGCTIFLIIPSIGPKWMNWVYVYGILLGILLLSLF